MQDDAQSFRSASALFFRGSWSATQSGASSVGPSEHVGGKRRRLVCRWRPGAAPKKAPAGHRISELCSPITG